MKTQSLSSGECKVPWKVCLPLHKAQYSAQSKVLCGTKDCRQNHYFCIVYEISSLKSILASHYCKNGIMAFAGNQASQFFTRICFCPFIKAPDLDWAKFRSMIPFLTLIETRLSSIISFYLRQIGSFVLCFCHFTRP